MKNLKLFSILITVFFAFSVTAFSQEGLGVKAGLNIANISFDPDIVGTSSQIGFQFGVFYEYAVNESFNVRPGLAYSGKGAGEEDGDGSISLNYLEIPIDAVYKLDVGTNKVAIHAGPYIGLLLSASDQDGDDVKDMFKGSDFGLNIGAAYELENILVGLNYGLGLSDVLDDPSAPDDLSAKNANFSIFAGYRF